MKKTLAYPPQTYKSVFVDYDLSKRHVVKGKLINDEQLPYWKPEERYLKDVEDFRNTIKSMDLEAYAVVCKNCKSFLFDLYTFQDQIVAIEYGDALMAYIPRDDGLIGFECACGDTDTRLSDKEKQKNPDMYPVSIKATTTLQAKFNEKGSSLISTKKKEPRV